MDASASVQVSGLDDPQVVAVEVREWAAVAGELALFEVKLLELC